MKTLILATCSVLSGLLSSQSLENNFFDPHKTVSEGWKITSNNFPVGNYAEDEAILWYSGLSFVTNIEDKTPKNYLALNHSPLFLGNKHINALISPKVKLRGNDNLKLQIKLPSNFSELDEFSILFLKNGKEEELTKDNSKIFVIEGKTQKRASKDSRNEWKTLSVSIPENLVDQEGYIAFVLSSVNPSTQVNNQDFLRLSNVSIPLVSTKITNKETKQFSINNFEIFPNPVNEEVNVISDFDAEMQLVDATGRKVLVVIVKKEIKNTISLKNIPAGVYYLMANSGNQVFKKKIIKN